MFARRPKTAPPAAQTVLVTGAAGHVGMAACAELGARGHRITGLDLVGPPAGHRHDRWVAGHLNDADTLADAMAGVDTIVHLAARLEDVPFDPDLINTNIRGIHRIFEAARNHNVKRLVLASSCNVVFWHTVNGPRRLGPQTPYAPLDDYSITKVLAEQFAYLYAHHRGVPTLVLRLGWLPRDEANRQKMIASPDYHDWYLSRADAGRALALAVEADPRTVGNHAVVFITSRPRSNPPFDLRPARRLMGYNPVDTYHSDVVLKA